MFHRRASKRFNHDTSNFVASDCVTYFLFAYLTPILVDYGCN